MIFVHLHVCDTVCVYFTFIFTSTFISELECIKRVAIGRRARGEK